MKLEFFNRFSKNTQVSDLMKIRLVGSVLSLVDRQIGQSYYSLL